MAVAGTPPILPRRDAGLAYAVAVGVMLESGVVDRTEMVQQFVERARTLGCEVHQVADDAGLRQVFRDAGVQPAGTDSVMDRYGSLLTMTPARGEPAQEVAAMGRFGVAETGSVAVVETNADRGACFLAERLWLLLQVEEIVPNLDDALARVGGLIGEGTPYFTLMSGPSRSADIERVITVGVHGPRMLAIVVIGAEA